ncbi:MAG TPA: hypothetical protein VEH30_15545 [Terriglobales bacterium]|nr:hypothetical protein [Terriglobales bacterium]
MRRSLYLGVAVALLAFAPWTLFAQSDDVTPLGDLARSLRKAKEPSKEPAVPVVIDNDNLSKIMDDVENRRLNGMPLLSLDSAENTFRMSSPDGTCSLSFNADAASLLTPPFVAEELPQTELVKLEGPAKIDGDRLQVRIFNGTDWNLKEITISVTIVRRVENANLGGVARLLSAVAQDTLPPPPDSSPSGERPSDVTMLFHLKGTALPMATTIFRERLTAGLAPNQEWHWAIVSAKGIPPSPVPLPSFGSETPPPVFP